MDIPFFKSIQSSGFSFFDKKSSILGVDIGATSVKVVQLRIERERAVLETYGELATGPYGGKKVGQAVHLADPKASEVLADVVRETGATAKMAVVSVPLRNSFVTLVDMPLMEVEELKGVMQYEARRYIPIPLSEVIIDWWRLPDDHRSGDGTLSSSVKKSTMSVLLVAVPKDVVERYKRVISDAGLESSAFEIETFSAMRSAVGKESHGVLLVD